MKCEHCGGDITAQVAFARVGEAATELREHLGRAAKARVVDPLINQLRRALARRFRAQGKMYASRRILLVPSEKVAFMNVFVHTTNKAYDGGAVHVAGELAVLQEAVPRLTTRRQPAGYDRLPQQLEDEIDATTRDRIAKIEAYGPGRLFSAAAIAGLIRDLFKQFAINRAQTIATHEVSRAFHAGGSAVAKIVYEEGAHVQRHWDPQDNPCELCQENEDAGWIGEDEQYPNPGDPPLHVGCVCSESYRIAGQGAESEG